MRIEGSQRGNMGLSSWDRVLGFHVFLLFIFPQLTQVWRLFLFHDNFTYFRYNEYTDSYNPPEYRKWILDFQEMGLGSGGTPLYSPDDKIVLLNSTNFQVPFISFQGIMLTIAMIPAHHMWFRTGMACRILLKLVRRHFTILAKEMKSIVVEFQLL